LIVLFGVVGYSTIQLQRARVPSGLRLPHIHLYYTHTGCLRIIARFLFIASLFFLCWATIHWTVGSGPLGRLFLSKTNAIYPAPIASRALFFVIDRSGSMGEPSSGAALSKMDMVKRDVQKFLEAEAGEDLFGLMSFARAAMVRVPLSRDRDFFAHSLENMVPETEDVRNGTALGYAIFKSSCLIEACREFAKTKKSDHFVGQAIVVITDGLEEPHPADRAHPFRSMRYERSLQYAKERGIKVYYINIDKKSYERMPFIDRENIRALVEATGGIYGEVSPSYSLERFLSQVSSREGLQQAKSVVYASSLGWWLIGWAVVFCSLSRLLETSVLRVVQ